MWTLTEALNLYLCGFKHWAAATWLVDWIIKLDSAKKWNPLLEKILESPIYLEHKLNREKFQASTVMSQLHCMSPDVTSVVCLFLMLPSFIYFNEQLFKRRPSNKSKGFSLCKLAAHVQLTPTSFFTHWMSYELCIRC